MRLPVACTRSAARHPPVVDDSHRGHDLCSQSSDVPRGTFGAKAVSFSRCSVAFHRHRSDHSLALQVRGPYACVLTNCFTGNTPSPSLCLLVRRRVRHHAQFMGTLIFYTLVFHVEHLLPAWLRRGHSISTAPRIRLATCSTPDIMFVVNTARRHFLPERSAATYVRVYCSTWNNLTPSPGLLVRRGAPPVQLRCTSV